jgi:hypothetical protein
MFSSGPVSVVGDAEWVEVAIREHWFSISKTRGTWQIYLPYPHIWDYMHHDEMTERARVFYSTANSVLNRLDVKYRLTSNGHGEYTTYYVARFGTWHQADKFAFMMGLEGFTYISAQYVKTGFHD